MSDFDDDFESLEERRERELDEGDDDWGDSIDDLDGSAWAPPMRPAADDDDDDAYLDEAGDSELERMEAEYFAGRNGDRARPANKRRPAGREAAVDEDGIPLSFVKPAVAPPPTAAGRPPGDSGAGASVATIEDGEALVDRFIDLTEQMVRIKNEISAVKKKIMDNLLADQQEAATSRARLVKRTRKYWQFSEAVTQLEVELKDLKREERESGVAQVRKESAYLSIAR